MNYQKLIISLKFRSSSILTIITTIFTIIHSSREEEKFRIEMTYYSLKQCISIIACLLFSL
jgi:hypothetical protein